MKPETPGQVETAGRNRDIARALLAGTWHTGLQASPFGWVAVVAFYSAVHYVNAYIWEIEGTILYHPPRRAYITAHPPLSGFLQGYLQLEAHARDARYTPGYVLGQQDAQVLVDTNLMRIEAIVCNALGVTPP